MTTALPVFVEPTAWPAVSEPLSFSTLVALRTCARSWALSRARFEPGALFDSKGRLEERATWGAIRGRAVHKSLERMLDTHQQNRGPAAGSWSLLQFWKRHLPPGGVPAVVAAALDEELATAERSSRNRPVMPWLRQSGARDLGDLVAAVNSKLALALQAGGPAARQRSTVGASRRELGDGSHAEADVAAELRGSTRSRTWRGTIDVARIGREEVSLVDYKGGDEQPSHREQLELYALLYAKDPVVNPLGRRATQLTLAYDRGQTIEWTAPDAAQLAALETRVCDEVEALIRATEARPPDARPSVEACGFCGARALCDAYWSEPIKIADAYFDLEVSVESRSSAGDELVGTALRCSRSETVGTFVRVLVPANQREQAREIGTDQRVRILGASAEPADTESKVTVVVLGPFAELVVIASNGRKP